MASWIQLLDGVANGLFSLAARSTSTVHRHSRPVDGTRGIGDEEEDDVGNRFGLDPLGEIAIGNRLPILRRVDAPA